MTKRRSSEDIVRQLGHKIETSADGQERPWHVWLNGQMLRDKTGVGRRFKTEQAAIEAAAKEIRSSR